MSSVQEWLPPHVSHITPEISVKRALPFRGGRGVGPFVFLDHMGPYTIRPGEKFDVAPHPHIGLSTLTYLFAGEILHRDSLGSRQLIAPGDVNWMTAGRGIAHSERTPAEVLNKAREMHGLQAWVALPVQDEDCAPSFEHHGRQSLPEFQEGGVTVRVVIGEAFGHRAPATTFLPLFYVHTEFARNGRLSFTPEAGHEAAFYVVEGQIEVDGNPFQGPGLLIFKPGQTIEIRSAGGAMGMLLGGKPLSEHRTIWWNFVSSSKEKIEAAKRRWAAQEFEPVPDETEFVPLPQPRER